MAWKRFVCGWLTRCADTHNVRFQALTGRRVLCGLATLLIAGLATGATPALAASGPNHPTGARVGQGAVEPAVPAPTSSFHIKVLAKRIPKTVAGVLKRGLSVLLRCTASCKASVDMRISKRIADELGTGQVIGHGGDRLTANRSRWIHVTLNDRAAAALRAADPASLPFKIRVQGDPVG
jgi:hypothetical protein